MTSPSGPVRLSPELAEALVDELMAGDSTGVTVRGLAALGETLVIESTGSLSSLPLAAALLARVPEAAVVVEPGPALHPVNLARTVATLDALHPGRIGILGRGGAALLTLLAVGALFETWPLAALEAARGTDRYTEDSMIARVSAPGTPQIGGPLTLPVPSARRPVLIAVDAAEADREPVIDLSLPGEALAVRAGAPIVGLAARGPSPTASGHDSGSDPPGPPASRGFRLSHPTARTRCSADAEPSARRSCC